MRSKRILAVLATTGLAAAVLGYALRGHRAAAADGSLPELVSLAPSDSQFIAYADLAVLRDSSLVRRLTAMAQPAKVDPDYAEFVRATGFDYQRDLDRAVIAGRPGGTSAQTVVLAEGRFDRGKIEQYALRTGKLMRTGDRSVYVVPSSTPGKNIAITFLGGDRVALFDGGDAAASAAGNPSLANDPSMRERLSRVAGAPLFAVAKGPSSGTTQSSVAGGFSSSLQSLRWVSFAARPDGDDIFLSAEGECDSPEQAQTVAAGLEILRGVLRTALTEPKGRNQPSPAVAAAAGELVGDARVSTDGVRVRLLLTITPEMVDAAASANPGTELPSRR